MTYVHLVSGWPKFQKFATDTFGNGSMRFAFNLPQVDIEILEFLKFQNFAHPVFQ